MPPVVCRRADLEGTSLAGLVVKRGLLAELRVVVAAIAHDVDLSESVCVIVIT